MLRNVGHCHQVNRLKHTALHCAVLHSVSGRQQPAKVAQRRSSPALVSNTTRHLRTVCRLDLSAQSARSASQQACGHCMWRLATACSSALGTGWPYTAEPSGVRACNRQPEAVCSVCMQLQHTAANYTPGRLLLQYARVHAECCHHRTVPAP
jgi:hypothetical protein